MNEIISNECVITGSMLNKNEADPLPDIINENFISKSHHKGPVIDMAGKKIGKLQIIKRMPNDKCGMAMWKCKCDCGNEIISGGSGIRNGHIKSCGCFQRERSSQYNKGLPYKWILAHLKAKSKIRKRMWNMILTYEELLDFVKITRCHYCDDTITWLAHSRKNGVQTSHKYNLDRKDNLKGYTKDNCVVCCTQCNFVKSNRFTYEEMVEIGKTFKELRTRREQPNIHLEIESPNVITSLIKSL